MTRKLNESDRAAVDMIFDRLRSAGGNGNGNGGNGHSEPLVMISAPVADERLSAVERILSALDKMPAPEPPADLAVRTLQRVSRQSGTRVVTPMAAPFINPSQPMA